MAAEGAVVDIDELTPFAPDLSHFNQQHMSGVVEPLSHFLVAFNKNYSSGFLPHLPINLLVYDGYKIGGFMVDRLGVRPQLF